MIATMMMIMTKDDKTWLKFERWKHHFRWSWELVGTTDLHQVISSQTCFISSHTCFISIHTCFISSHTCWWLAQTNVIVMASLVDCWMIILPPPYIKLHTTEGSYKSIPLLTVCMYLQDRFALIDLSRKKSYRAQVPSRPMWWSVARITWEHYRRWSR